MNFLSTIVLSLYIMLLKNKYSKKGLAHIVYADMPTDRRTKFKVEVASRLIIEIYIHMY